jgi:SAM-dependent methyltransferase
MVLLECFLSKLKGKEPDMQITELAIKYEPKRRFFRYLRFSLEWLILNKIPFLAKRMYEFAITERIVEYPFVHSNIGLKKGRILDVGCGNSKLPIELASRGYQVYAIDLQPYFPLLTHPIFKFVQGDIRKASFGDSFFDVVIAVSTIEHIGMEHFDDPEGDLKASQEIARITQVGGKLIITVPFGKRFIPRKGFRIYDFSRLKELLSPFEIEKIEYAIYKDRSWVPASQQEVQDFWAVAMVVAKKK